MKTTYLRNAGLTAGIVLLAATASAQHGGFRGGYRGGYGRGLSVGIGVRGGGFGLGFYRPYPRIGISLGVLPVGYYPFYWGSLQYYYMNGVFYTPLEGGGYQVAVPPVGAEVPNLPRNARSILIDGQQYYEYQGVYYKAQTTPEGKVVYIVAGKDGVLNTDNGNATEPPPPRVGDIAAQLPEGCRRIKLNGHSYYVSPDEVYFEEVHDGNQVGYRIVSLPEPDDEPNQQ